MALYILCRYLNRHMKKQSMHINNCSTGQKTKLMQILKRTIQRANQWTNWDDLRCLMQINIHTSAKSGPIRQERMAACNCSDVHSNIHFCHLAVSKPVKTVTINKVFYCCAYTHSYNILKSF